MATSDLKHRQHQSWTFFRGDSAIPLFIVLSGAPPGQTRRDLSSVTQAHWAIFPLFQPNEPAVLEKDLASGGVVVDGDPLDGRIAVVLTSADTETLEPGSYKDELQVTIGTSRQTFWGYIEIVGDRLQ